MTILEMVTGLMPYHECTSTAQIYRKVLNVRLNIHYFNDFILQRIIIPLHFSVKGLPPPELNMLSKLNERCCEIVRLCLLPQNQRPSATILLDHPFLHRNDEEDFQEVRSVILLSSILCEFFFHCTVFAFLSFVR